MVPLRLPVFTLDVPYVVTSEVNFCDLREHLPTPPCKLYYDTPSAESLCCLSLPPTGRRGKISPRRHIPPYTQHLHLSDLVIEKGKEETVTRNTHMCTHPSIPVLLTTNIRSLTPHTLRPSLVLSVTHFLNTYTRRHMYKPTDTPHPTHHSVGKGSFPHMEHVEPRS